MRLQVNLLFVFLFCASAMAANTETLKKPSGFAAGDFAVSGSVSTLTNTLEVDYHIASNWVIAPAIGRQSLNYSDSGGGVSTDYPSSVQIYGLRFYYVQPLRDNIFVEFGPSYFYTSQKYEAEGNTDQNTLTANNIYFDVRLLAMITNGFGVYSTVSYYNLTTDIKDTTSGSESKKTASGLQTYTLGVIYYLR